MFSSRVLVRIGRPSLFIVSVAALAALFSTPARAQSITNLALNKPARQSSLSPWSTGPNDAQGGVDGIKNGRFGFHTNQEPNPWWQVDLQQNCTLSEIRIFNRMDETARARTIRVLLSADGTSFTTVYSHNGTPFGGVTDGKPLIVNLGSAQARFVRLQLAETTYLHLDEVEVWGTTGGSPTPPPPPDPNVTGTFNGIWSSDLGFYIGLVQSNKSVVGYYWADGNWYRLLTGEVKGNVLAGRWDVEGWTGGFRFTLSANGKSFAGEATDDDGWVTFQFSGQYYSSWN